MTETYTRCPYPLAVQSYIFAKSEFDLPETLEWMTDNKVHHRPLELLETGQSWRARMRQPSDFVVGSLRTIRLGRGKSRVQAVVGCPKPAVRKSIVTERLQRKRRRAVDRRADERRRAEKRPEFMRELVAKNRRRPPVPPGVDPTLDMARLIARMPSGWTVDAWIRHHGIRIYPGIRRTKKRRR